MSDSRSISGTVNSNGTPRSGAEFSSTRVSKGHYLVSFRPAFGQIGGGAVTQIYPGDGDTRDNAVIITLSADSAYIKTGDSGGNTQDRDFTFVFGGAGAVAAAD